MADNNNKEARQGNTHHPHQHPQGPPPASAEPPQAREDAQAQAQATETQQRPDRQERAEAVAAKRREVAQGMRTSSARAPGTRRRPDTVAGDIEDDEAPRGTPVAQRVQRGQRTMRGIAERETLGHSDLVQQTADLVSQFKADPESVDPVQVQLLSVQAMVSYGGDVNQLKNELGRLRKEVELWRSQGGPEEQEKPKGRDLPGAGARSVRFARKQNRNGTPMRGRARR